MRASLVVAALALGVYAVQRDLEGFQAALSQIGVTRMLVALCFVVVGLAASAEAWRWSVAAVAGLLGRGAAWRVFFVTQLGKYLPGSIWTVVGQVEAAARHGLARPHMAIGALLFIAIHVLTGIVTAGLLLPWGGTEAFAAYGWAFLALPVAVVTLWPPVLTRLVDLALRIIKRDPLPRTLTGHDLLPAAAAMGPVWLAFGLAGLTLAAPLTDAPLLGLGVVVTGAFALSWVVGLLVIPAPAGLGVRDAVLVLTLADTLGTTAATSVAITLRVLHTLGDLLVGITGLRTGFQRPSPQASE